MIVAYCKVRSLSTKREDKVGYCVVVRGLVATISEEVHKLLHCLVTLVLYTSVV